jgi:hypothetical protein
MWQARPMGSLFAAITLAELRPTKKLSHSRFVVPVDRINNLALYEDLLFSNTVQKEKMFTRKIKVGKVEPCVWWAWMLHVDDCIACK